MGCVLGESRGWEGARRTSNTLKSDVSWVGTGGKLGRRAVAGARRGVKRKMTRRIYYAHKVILCLLCCLSGGPGLYREDTQPRLHTYVYMLIDTYILLHTENKQMQI